MAKKAPRSRRISRALDDLPGLFDAVDISFDTTPQHHSHTPFHTFPIPNPVPDPEPDITVSGPSAAATDEIEAENDIIPELTLRPEDIRRPEKLQFISLGSGSCGNCAYIGTTSDGILIDAGVDSKRVTTTLAACGIKMENVKGIILTHDHGDHVRYAYNILRYNRHMRLYATNRTLKGILRRHSISRRITDYHTPIFKEIPFQVAQMEITAFEVSHDGSDNVGFSIIREGTHFVVATDTGYITPRADFYLRQAAHIMIEADYDLHMLMQSNRTEHLKARIISATGHMDNTETARYLSSIYTPAIKTIMLCHLSEEANTPELATGAVTAALTAAGISVGDGSGSITARQAAVQVYALPRMTASPLIILS
ncbi:MAG: MBL fold metallo-hydrolase [Muribaculaceae bacterium]|nr:MBL fold metallo-hydrolase [Muribaculaceae bacterium]